MPRSADQKLKLLYLIQYLSENTDEDHPAPMTEILNCLEANGIHAERKSIYNDVEALNRMGYEVIFTKESPSGYYLTGRDFELAELKLLADAVSSSKFITRKKSDELIGKLEKQTSRFQAVSLQRQVYVSDRVKTENESVLYTIDSIHEAIAENRRITFRYYEWNVKRELVPRRNGEIYSVDPIALLWDNENYYLAAYRIVDGKPAAEYTEEDIHHFRVDKIRNLRIEPERRICAKLIKSFRPAEYGRAHFGMFSGDAEVVKLRFAESMIGVVIDRFGKDIPVMPDSEEGWYSTRANVQVSDLFFGWVAGFRGKIGIVTPEVREQYKKFLSDNLNTL